MAGAELSPSFPGHHREHPAPLLQHLQQVHTECLCSTENGSQTHQLHIISKEKPYHGIRWKSHLLQKDDGGLWSGRCMVVPTLETHIPSAELREGATGSRLSLNRLHEWGWRAQVRLIRVDKVCEYLGRAMLCRRLWSCACLHPP